MLSYKIKKANSRAATQPAIILLHGYGSNADDLFSFADYLPNDHTIISLEAPYSTPFGGSAWYSIHFDASQDKWSDIEEAKKSLTTIVNQLDSLTKEHDLNPKDISLMGFSQGAILSWSLLMDHPTKIRRGVCMSGYIDSQLLSQPLGAYQNVLAYASHGINDVTVPYEWAKNSIEQIKKNNPSVSFNSYPDGHNVSPENFRDILKWLSDTNEGLDR
ncbi:MAG: dienelactone hydrolase family protein [Bacteroidetes bacterium]|nr:dienelactone hydrolase family protein [Bacteroidota bacterium]MDA0936030.1 dienelactone hydrolase family protein [Bacteroidota bacterium]